MKQEQSKALIEMTKQSYNDAADEFSRSRPSMWREIGFLFEDIENGARVLDIGCGNGRLFETLKSKGVDYTGLDNSKELIAIANEKNPEATFIIGDATELPFDDAEFDVVISLATIHHIPSKELRKKFITEAARVLKPGGTLIITSWYLWQWHFLKAHLKSIPKLLTGTYDWGDIVLTLGQKHGGRFLHAFTLRSLSKLMLEAGLNVDLARQVKRPSGFANLVATGHKSE